MKKIFIALLILFLTLIFSGRNIFAQTTGGLGQFQELIQRDQQRLNDEEFRRQELQRSLNLLETIDEKNKQKTHKPIADNQKERCTNVREIKVAGNTLLSTSIIKKITDKYIGKCLAISDIDQMMNAITNEYVDRGYITSRAYMIMPQKKLRDGILQIKIIEGKVSEIHGLTGAETIIAFPSVRGEIFQLRNVEQGLDQLNKLQSNNAKMDIKPSDKEGYSDVVITNEIGDRNRISVFTDNAGSKSTGEFRVGSRFSRDNFFGINDQINLSYTNSPQEHYGFKNANSFTAGYSAPFGYWTFTNNFSYSNYKTSFAMPISGNRFYSYGDSFSNALTIDRVLFRGQKYKVSGGVGLTYKSNSNYTRVLDLVLKSDVSSRNLSVFNAELPMTFYIGNGILYIKPSFIQGLKLFDSLDDNQTTFSQKAQYYAFKFYGYYSYYHQYFSNTFMIDSQYSPDELFSSEAFYIGGEYSVRGFKNDGVQGDSGLTLKNDFAFRLPAIFATENRFVKMFTPSLFIDYGYVDSNSKFIKSSSLIGVGAKLAVNHKYFDTSISYAKILEKENWMQENYAIYFSASVNVKF